MWFYYFFEVIKMAYFFFKEWVLFDSLIATGVYKLCMERGKFKNMLPCVCCCLTRVQEIIILCFIFLHLLWSCISFKIKFQQKERKEEGRKGTDSGGLFKLGEMPCYNIPSLTDLFYSYQVKCLSYIRLCH